MADKPAEDSKEKSITLSKEDYDDAAELVDAVKTLNRSVATLNRALIKLQDKIAHQCKTIKSKPQKEFESETLH